MKRMLLTLVLLLIPLSLAQEVKIEYFVNDYSNLLSFEEANEIELVLKEIYDSKIAEYSVVIVDSLNGEDIEGYSYRLAEGNLGDIEKNNGLLLLIALNDRMYRFEVGRGLEPVLPDIVMGRIGREFIEPNFKSEEYAKGIIEASFAVRDTLFENKDSEFYVEKQEFPYKLVILFGIVAVFIFLSIAASVSNSMPAKKGVRRSNADYFMAAWLLGQMMKGGKGGFGGSGGFGGGGGFGGFGGGSFGGGGAGGRF